MIDGPRIFVSFFGAGGMLLTFYAAYLPPIAPFRWVNLLSIFVFRSLTAIRTAFIVALALHVIEGVYAWHLSKKVDPSNSGGWFWQTLAQGFLSLLFLLKRCR